ncbi:MAG: hypothetical protein HOP03_04655 [Lysobacter sp.]|nr:hypothetical protein [Lysobacter sp.]
MKAMNDLFFRGSAKQGCGTEGMRLLQPVLLCLVAMLCGCQSLIGMPKSDVKPPLVTENANKFTLQTECNTQATLRYTHDTKERNAWINNAMTCINDNHHEFVRELRRSEAGWGIATGITTLALGIASSLTPSSGVKANYAAASLLITGSDEVINKEAFLEQTVTALIAAMDANRKKALVPIIRGMSASVDLYPIGLAHEDLLAYQRAGSLMAGLTFVSANAQTSIEESNTELAKLRENVPLTDAETKRRECLTMVLEAIKIAHKETDQPRLYAAYRNVHPSAVNLASVSDLVEEIKIKHRFHDDKAFDEALIEQLKKQGFTVPCGGS